MNDEYNHIPTMLHEIAYLNEHAVAVGILEDDFLIMIAQVNNDGTIIHAKGNGYLMIPVKENGKVASFVRKRSVTIPARHFLERTLDNYAQVRTDYMADRMADLQDGTTSGHAILDELGRMTVRQMKNEIAAFANPKNAPLTIHNKGKDDPLVDTGKLHDSIAYKII